MMLKKLNSLATFATLSLMVACSSTPKFSPVAPSAKNISGVWVLDESLSQNVSRFSGRGSLRSLDANTSEQGEGRQKGKGAAKGNGGARGSGGRGKGRSQRVGQGEGRGGKEGSSTKRVRSEDADSYQRQRSFPTLYVTRMKIEQDNTGMGIGFDQEPYQDIDWGVTKGDRSTVNAGWNDENKIEIIREAQRGSFTETYSINESGNVLTQTILMHKSKNQRTFTRVFNLEQAPEKE